MERGGAEPWFLYQKVSCHPLRACKVKQVIYPKKHHRRDIKLSDLLHTRAEFNELPSTTETMVEREGKNVVAAARSGKVHRNLMENVIFPINIGTAA